MAVSFGRIEDAALRRLGEETLAGRLPDVKDPDALRAIPDDRYLAGIAKRIFAAGFRWRVVDAKWPEIEEAFDGFEPAVVAAYGAARIGALIDDRRVIRHGRKIGAIVDNASVLGAISAEAGGFGAWVAGWSRDQTVELWETLADRFSMLGGASGPRFLRGVGRDTFILTPDVLGALETFGVYRGKGTSKRDRRAIQEVFSRWADETGRPLAHLSVILAGAVP